MQHFRRQSVWVRTSFALVGLSAFLVGARAFVARAAEPDKASVAPVDFVKDVQPILSARCYECHGPEKQKGGFRADTKESAFRSGDSGEKPVVAGEADKSHLIALVRGDKKDEFMPPKGERLTKEQVDVLVRWVQQGANWPDGANGAERPRFKHWAFNKPVKVAPPTVKQAGWVRNPIDNFILAMQESKGLKPSPEADKYALIRRASLDLTGLPPTPAEVKQFLADTAPDAYDRLVDRLLASPHFGERWARVWLDIARYADSAGYGSDPLRMTAWPYRDYVIKSFNSNKPFDQFTIEQIAGDLLPNPTRDQIVATAFHRNTMTNTEGGTDDEEWRVAAVKDRTNVTVQAWMGLTMGCAECHSHKYDPITNRDYYSFFAFFNQTEDNDQPTESPTMPVPSTDQEKRIADLKSQIANVQAEIDNSPQSAGEQAKWESEIRDETAGWVTLQPETLKSKGGAALAKQVDGSILVSGKRANTDVYTIDATTDLRGITAFRVEALPDASLPKSGPGRGDDGNFVLNDFKVAVQTAGQTEGKIRGRYVRVDLPGTGKILHLAEVQAFSGGANLAPKGTATQSSTGFGAPAQRAIDGNTDGVFANNSVSHTNEEANPWWEVDLKASHELNKVVVWPRQDSGMFYERLSGMRVSVLDENHKAVWSTVIAKGPKKDRTITPGGPSNVQLKDATASFSQPQFEVAKAIDADAKKDSGWAVGGNIGKASSAAFETSLDNVGADDKGPAKLTFTLTQNNPNLPLGKFRISATTRPRPVRELPGDVSEIVAIPLEQRTPAQSARAAAYFKSIAPYLAPQREQLAKLTKQLGEVVPPQCAIMKELPEKARRETHMLVKGNFMSKGDKVTPAVPVAFNPLPKGAPANRLGVAKWLVDKENPLTARVAANRFWAALFGNGIVLTQEDFGTMGQPPTHPELLDYLAIVFRDDLRWDIKALLKLMVTSATYRQSSKQTPEILEGDPTNKWLTRAPRLRLEAEQVRDQALAISGLLSEKMFGPSVYPPQPAGLWQAAFNGERTYPTSSGEDKYRRGVYTFWRRTVPYPSMAAFDAPSREQCTVRRIQTSTPIQAFVTMNDPVYVECSQALARRIVKEGGATPEQRAEWALKLCLARPANPEQVKQVVALYNDELSRYKKDTIAATSMATDPLGPLPTGCDAADMAAWTVVSNVLLNVDGVLTKG